MENWRFIKENNDYMVSDHGRIMSLKKPQKKILRAVSSTMVMRLYTSIRKGFMPRAMCTDW